MFEIERKYLLKENSEVFTTPNFFFYFESLKCLINTIRIRGTEINQGYFSVNQGVELAEQLGLNIDFVPSEARVRQKGDKYYFTLKSKGLEKRNELETTISQELFENLYSTTQGNRVEKLRLNHNIEGLIYEIDYYKDRKLMVVEVEVKDEKDLEKIIVLGKDVTNDKTYKNKNLAK